MNDFLTRLAARTLGLAPTVKPFIASRFERPANDLGGEAKSPAFQPLAEPAIDLSQEVQQGNESQQKPGNPDIALRASAELKPTTPSLEQSSSKRVAFPVEAVERAKGSISLPAAEEPFFPREQPEATRATNRRDGEMRSPRETAPMMRGVDVTPLPKEPKISASPASQQGLEMRSEIARPISPRSNEERTDKMVNSSISPADRRPEEPEVAFHKELESTTLHGEASVDRASDRSNLAGRDDVRAGLHVAPEVRVTIGRVEVRAVAPPQTPVPAAKSPRSGPALSLEAYLNRRNGAAR